MSGVNYSGNDSGDVSDAEWLICRPLFVSGLLRKNGFVASCRFKTNEEQVIICVRVGLLTEKEVINEIFVNG